MQQVCSLKATNIAAADYASPTGTVRDRPFYLGFRSKTRSTLGLIFVAGGDLDPRGEVASAESSVGFAFS
jgi:hypothetical protein